MKHRNGVIAEAGGAVIDGRGLFKASFIVNHLHLHQHLLPNQPLLLLRTTHRVLHMTVFIHTLVYCRLALGRSVDSVTTLPSLCVSYTCQMMRSTPVNVNVRSLCPHDRHMINELRGIKMIARQYGKLLLCFDDISIDRHAVSHSWVWSDCSLGQGFMRSLASAVSCLAFRDDRLFANQQ